MSEKLSSEELASIIARYTRLNEPGRWVTAAEGDALMLAKELAEAKAGGDDVLEAANGSLMATNSRLGKELAEAKAEIERLQVTASIVDELRYSAARFALQEALEIEQIKQENLAYQTRMHNDDVRIAELSTCEDCAGACDGQPIICENCR